MAYALSQKIQDFLAKYKLELALEGGTTSDDYKVDCYMPPDRDLTFTVVDITGSKDAEGLYLSAYWKAREAQFDPNDAVSLVEISSSDMLALKDFIALFPDVEFIQGFRSGERHDDPFKFVGVAVLTNDGQHYAVIQTV